MSRKVALLVRAEVATRIVVEVADDFDAENIRMEEFDKIANHAKSRLVSNLQHDYMDCVTDIELDTECPHTDYIKAIRDFIEVNGENGVDEGVDYKVYGLNGDMALYLNSDDNQVLSVFIRDGKLMVAFDDNGYLFQDTLDEDTAECIYTHLHECNLI